MVDCENVASGAYKLPLPSSIIFIVAAVELSVNTNVFFFILSPKSDCGKNTIEPVS